MINTLIIHEKATENSELTEQLENFSEEINLSKILFEKDDLISHIRQLKPGLIFWVVNQINQDVWVKVNFFVNLGIDFVLVSKLKEIAYDAIRFSATGFLLSPIQPQEVQFCIQKAVKRVEERTKQIRQQQLLEQIHKRLYHQESLGIPTMQGIDVVQVSDIIRCEGVQRCTIAYTKSGKKLISSYNIGEFIKLLEPFHFFPVHKSHLVNLREVKYVSKESYLLMSDGESIPISRRRKTKFLSLIPRP